MSLKQQITDDMKAAMKSGDKHTVGVTRLINAAIKQKEIDERIPLDNDGVLTILQKMVKQRRDSIKQYSDANREDLAQIEHDEIKVIERYLPAQTRRSRDYFRNPNSDCRHWGLKFSRYGKTDGGTQNQTCRPSRHGTSLCTGEKTPVSVIPSPSKPLENTLQANVPT
ncbi:hypothetical protein DF23_002213 [Xylella fastidiosa]|nr:hypothetical protein [Xylella fastidiosa]